MTHEITLRLAVQEDIPEIISLYTETVLTVCSPDYSAGQLNAWASLGEDRARWTQRITTQYFLVAETDNKITGFASLGAEYYLDVFYVSKAMQRNGVARCLYRAIAAKAATHPEWPISADVSTTARSFFEHYGFKVIAQQEKLLEGLVIVNYKMKKLPPFSGEIKK